MRDLTETCENATLGSVGGGGQGREDEELLYVTLTKKKRYVREHLLHRRTRVVFTFGETARESFVTTAIAMNMLEAACAPLPPREAVTVRSQVGPELPAASARHAGLRAKIAEVLEFAEVILVPLVSPTGRKLAESGGFCEVGNARMLFVVLLSTIPIFSTPSNSRSLFLTVPVLVCVRNFVCIFRGCRPE